MYDAIAHGPENLNCPFWQKPMSEVCHKCPMWISVSGTNALGKDITNWTCSLRFTVDCLMEVVQQSRESTKSTQQMRNMMAGAVINSANRQKLENMNGEPALIEN